jgi:hypothetical protein
VVDADTGKLLPSRVYVRAEDGTWFFPAPIQRTVPPSPMQAAPTTPDPWRCTPPFRPSIRRRSAPGRYTITAEHGKEYLPESKQVTIGGEAASVSCGCGADRHAVARLVLR